MIKLHPKTREAYQLFHDGVLAFARAEQAGIRVGTDKCHQYITELSSKIEMSEQEVLNSKFGRHWSHSIKGRRPNLNSNHQLAHFLYAVKKLEPPKLTASGKGSTDDEALQMIAIPEVLKILEIRKLRKIRDTYLEAYLREQVDGWIHPIFNLHLVRTYRSSSDRPNFQNIPKRDKEAMKICRSVLFPRHGHQFLSMDYSGIEVKMACVYTQDEKLIYDVVHGDMHRDMAIELYQLDDLDKHDPNEKVLRQGAKNSFVFPQFYGDYYGNCAPNLLRWAKIAYLRDGTPAVQHLEKRGLVKLDKKGEIRNSDAFTEHVKKVEDDFWNRRYRAYGRWKDRVWRKYQMKGYVDMYTGFRCGGQMSKKDITNYPLQGTAFHCLLWTFIEVDRRMREEKWDSRLVSQVHDELTLDAHPDEVQTVAKAVKDIATNQLVQHWAWLKGIPIGVEFDLGPVDGSMADKEYIDI